MALKMHASITPYLVAEAVRRRMQSLDNPGFCLACGLEVDGVEPDAENYECESCGEHQVWGADQILVELAS